MCHAVVTVRRLSIVAEPRRLLVRDRRNTDSVFQHCISVQCSVCHGRGWGGALLRWTAAEQLRLHDTAGDPHLSISRGGLFQHTKCAEKVSLYLSIYGNWFMFCCH